jgi:hypothetical protein
VGQPDWTQPASNAAVAALGTQLATVISNTNPINNAPDYGQQNIPAASTVIYAAVGTWGLVLYNPSATDTVWVGGNPAQVGKGTPLLPGGYHSWTIKDITLYGISDGGTVAVSYNRFQIT